MLKNIYKIIKKEKNGSRGVVTGRRRSSSEYRDDGYTFRINRTLTGSTSNSIETSGQHQQLVSPRNELRTLQKKRRKNTFGLIFFLVILGFVSFLLYQFVGSVKVEVQGSLKTTPNDKYAASVQKFLSLNPMDRFRFNIKKDELLKYIQDENPEIDSLVEISESGIGQATIVLKNRTPVASWSVNNKSYYVDENGVSFSDNYLDDPKVVIDDKSGVEVNSGTSVISNRFLSYVGRVVSEFKLYEMEVSKVIIPYSTTRQISVQLSGHEKMSIKMTIDRNVGEQVEDAVNMIKFLNQNSKSPEYIDVRVKGKAYYK